MAEIGLVASLLGISSFGIQLSTTLYRFGSNVSSARDQTDYIARHVTLYSDVLELLAQRIDDDEPIHSRKALNLVDEIYDQSYDLFDKIEDLLPDPGDKISFMQKIKWNFKKIKVDLLVAEIEYLKSTVNLLVSILYAGKKIRSYNRRRRSKKAEKEVNVQFARAQNAIVEQVNATAAKENLQTSVDKEEQKALEEATGNPDNQISSALVLHAPQITQLNNNSAIVRFKQSLGKARTVSEERSLVIQNSINLVQELLDQWTTLADHSTEADAADLRNTSIRSADEVLSDRGSNSGGNNPATVEPLSNSGASHGPTTIKDADSLSEMYLMSQNKVKALEAELSRLKAAASGSTISGAENLQPSNPVNFKQPTVSDDVTQEATPTQNKGRNRRGTGVAFEIPILPAAAPVKGILKPARETPFPGDPNQSREDFLASKHILKPVQETPFPKDPIQLREDVLPLKGILKPARETPFPEDPIRAREGVLPLKDASKEGIPPYARWTKISRALVNPEALELAKERFEERDEYTIVWRVLTKEEIMKLAEKTKEIREARDREWTQEASRAKAENERLSSEGTEQLPDRRPPSNYTGGSGERTDLYGDQLHRSTSDLNPPVEDWGSFDRPSTRRENAPRHSSVSLPLDFSGYTPSSDEEMLPKKSTLRGNSRTKRPGPGPAEDPWRSLGVKTGTWLAKNAIDNLLSRNARK